VRARLRGVLVRRDRRLLAVAAMTAKPDRDRHTFAPFGKAPSASTAAEEHPDWPWPPSHQDVALEADLRALLDRIQAERSEIRRHGMWRVYAAKVRLRSDAQIRRMAIEGMEKVPQ